MTSILVLIENLMEHLQMKLCQKQKSFSEFFLHFGNLDSILNISKTNDDTHS